MPPNGREEKKEGNVMQDLWMFIGILAVLITLWIMNGGPHKTSVKSLFINSPIAPASSTVSGTPSVP